jgi:hypothetical protein
VASITRRRARIFQFGQCICGRKATAWDWRAEGGRSRWITFSYENGLVIEIAPQMGAHAQGGLSAVRSFFAHGLLLQDRASLLRDRAG